MSVIGCYTLDLYCRFAAASHGGDAGTREHPFNYFPHQFTGETFAECKRAARKRGWTFQRDGDATCPICAYGQGARADER